MKYSPLHFQDFASVTTPVVGHPSLKKGGVLVKCLLQKMDWEMDILDWDTA